MAKPASSDKNNSKTNGSPEDDILNGDVDSGTVDGKSGDDIVTGGAGDDWVKGGSGADRLIYRVTDNNGTLDRYDGGSGTDTLVLEMSRSDWMRDEVQADVANFLVFLQSGNGTLNGKGFLFTSLGLEVRKIEKFEVFVDGKSLDPRDEAVVANDDNAISTTEHSLIKGDVITNDLVPDVVRAVELIDPVAQGELTLQVNGQYEYDPGMVFDYLAEGETASVSFGYRVSDADRDSDTARVNLTITGTNDTPIANADSGSTDENAALIVDVLANDTDVDASDTHTVDAATIRDGLGSVAIVANKVQWTPGTDYDYLAQGEEATVTIDYTQSDNNGATADAVLTIKVVGSNDTPLAFADTGSSDENASLIVDVLANDTDVDASDTHTVDAATIRDGLGSVAIVANKVQWTPGSDYDYLALGEEATVTIDYTQSDNNGAKADAVLTIKVVGSNDTPIAFADTGSSDENASLIVDVLANDTDVDVSDTHTVDAVTIRDGLGSVAIVANKVQWTPGTDYDYLALGEEATVTIDYTQSDNNGAKADAVLTIKVVGSNDTPIAFADTGSSDENASLIVDVLANDTDVDVSDTHTVDAVTIRDGLGSVAIVANKVQWTPSTDYDYLALGEEATVTIDYTQSDNNGATADAVLTIKVIGSNDTPLAFADTGSSDENASLIVDVLANDTDVDASDTHTVDAVTIRDGLGSVAIVANKVQWTPGSDYDYLALGEEATVTIDYTQSDNNGATADAVLTIKVIGSNDTPIAFADTGSSDENASLIVDVLANDTDVDASDTHTVDAVTIREGLGSVAIVANKVQWTPGTDYDYLALGEEATVTIDYTQSDNNGATADAVLTIKVVGSNDTPLAFADTGSSDENASLIVDVLANDTDVDASDTHTVDAATIREGLGSVAIVANKVQWTPGTDYDYLALGEEATVTIDYTQSDNNGATADAVLTIKVVGSNDTPIAFADTGSSDENVSLIVDVLANDTDVDASDTHTVDAATIRDGLGSVAIVANKVQWTPGTDYDYLALGEEATVTIDYTQSDNNGAKADAVLTIKVVGSNDKPVANVDQASTEENATIAVDVLANDTDLDKNDTHTVNQATITSGLGAAAIVNNKIEWSPGEDYDYLAQGETATVLIDYIQRDNNGSEDGSTLAIEVVGTNDKPVVAAALSSEASEQDPVYSIDLLAGASDLDQGAVLSVLNLAEPTGKGGWTLSNNRITIDPNHFDKLNNGDVSTLNFAYQVIDEHGAHVDQVLNLNINGFTDAPFLEITASAGPTVNAINLTITSQPASDERVALSFRNLEPGIEIYDSALNDVTAGIANFSGTEVFTLVMPALQDTLGNLTIAASGFADDGQVLGESAGVVPLEFDFSNTKNTLIFSSEDQGIWSSGDAPMVHFHEYLPLLGGVAQTWNPTTKLWEKTGTAPWTSGSFPAFSSEFNIEDIRTAVKAVPQAVLDEAKNTFDNLVAGADAVWNAAKSVYEDAVVAATNVYNALASTAQYVFENTIAAAANNTIELAQAAYNEAVQTAAGIREGAIAVFGWLGGWVSDGAWATYNAAVDAAQAVFNVALSGVEAVTVEARNALNGTLAAGEWVKNNSIAAALAIRDSAEADYNSAKSGVIATAETAFNEAQKLVDDTVAIVDQMEGKTVLNVDAELFAEVGIKVDFVLDSGSVDTEVTYELDSIIQHNRSTDVIEITPSFTNKTTGQTVAFETVSPNATFKVALLYEVGATFDMFLDSYLISNGQTIFDISGDAAGLNVHTTISTGGLQAVVDGAEEAGASTPGLAVGEITLIDFDSTKLTPFEIPFLESITDGSLKVEVAVPTVKATGTAGTYSDDYFEEGTFINVHPSEIIESLLNLVTAKLDLSPEMRAKYGLGSIADKTFLDALDVVGQALSASIFDILSDGKIDKVPFFILDARDETSNQLLHGNFISDDVIGSTVTDELGNFGFYAGYAESNDIFKVTMDVDQAYSWIINEVVKLIIDVASEGAAKPILDRLPTINPLNLTFGISEILKVIEAPNEIAKQIDKYLNLEINLETADLEVHSALHFSQDFTLSIDDMSYVLTLEDNTQLAFAANQQGSIKIDDASSHDANGDGVVDYSLNIVPSAMFSNDTEFGLSYGYLLDFLQGTLKADLKLPVGDLFPGLPPIVINMLDLKMGPLLRVKGDLDLWSVDIFEDRFDFDIGSQNVAGDFETAEPISVIGIASTGDQGFIV